MLIQLFLPLILKKTPFPVRIKEHAKVSIVVNKSYIIAPKPVEQIKVEPSVAMVKDLLVGVGVKTGGSRVGGPEQCV